MFFNLTILQGMSLKLIFKILDVLYKPLINVFE